MTKYLFSKSVGCFIIILIFTGNLFSQLTNGNFNYLLQLRQGGGWGNNGPRGQTMLFNAISDFDNAPTFTDPNFSNNANLCYNYSGLTGPETAQNIFTSQIQGPFNKTDLSLICFNKYLFSGSACDYVSASPFINDTLRFQSAFLINDPGSIPKTADNFNEFTLQLNPGFARFRDYWRYTGGASLATPLKFGTINNGMIRTHVNNNYETPYSDASYNLYGYQNTYTPSSNIEFTGTPDVAYTFDISAPSSVVISTDNPGTNFDTKIHLVKITGTGPNDFVYLQANDDIDLFNNRKSKIEGSLCGGTYGIIVEGYGFFTGNFELTVLAKTYTPQDMAGRIENGHPIPNPQELFPDYVADSSSPHSFFDGPALTIAWEKSQNEGANWLPVNPPATDLAYLLPVSTASIQYRRISTGCGNTFISNTALIRLVAPNGVISGKVKSISGAGVKGIAMAIYKNGVSIPGSPANFTYRDTTDDQGNYSIQRIYYGRTDTSDGTQFAVKPYKLNHRFDNDTLLKDLSNVVTQLGNIDFVDSTVYSISGRAYQQCTNCTSISGTAETQTCPLDSVRLSSNVAGVIPVFTGFSSQYGDYGHYALSAQNPGNYTVTASYRNHLFDPPARTLSVTDDQFSIDFKDTVTHVISGRLTAGCNDYIGTATLEFTDILPNDGAGNPRVSCFRKRVTTNAGSGFYSIRLPARKYRVKLVPNTFVADPGNTAPVNGTDIDQFFETSISKDSLVRDITVSDTTLNLVYQRPPTISIEGLDNDCNRTPADSAFAIIRQSINKTFRVKVFQGPAVKACPAADSTLHINTNIQQDDASESLAFITRYGVDTITLKGGVPNIVYPYYKTLNIQFTDIFNRAVQVNKNIVVTGVKANTGTFATVSPEIPLMVLHDPPGDNSFSFWETSQASQTALRFFTAKNEGGNLWAEVKLGTKLLTGIGVATETEIWGSIRGTVDINSRNSSSDETIITSTTTQNFSTSNNPSVTGDEGDVFIGAALNLKYAVANEIKFTAPCNVTREQKLMIANDGFATQYIYSESHIRNTLIPTLINFRDNPGNTPAQTNNYTNQIAVWQQVLANNDANKRRAVFDKNISFDGSAGPVTSTTTTSATKNSTIEFNMEINKQVALELGFESAGTGASGGGMIAFKTETGNSTTNTTIDQTTMGYTLDDDDNGDYFSVNVKKDPVYNTPVFEMVAGTSSCPKEPGTQPRDEMQLVAPVPVVTGIAPDGEAEFILQLSNTSQSGEQRTYQLSFVQSSNPNGAVVTIGGSPVITPIAYTIGYLGQVQVVVKVRRGAANIFSYEGLQFILTDNCGDDIEKTVLLSAFFTSTCSNIVLSAPENNWVSSSFDNNLLPVLFKGYNQGNLTSVTLEYSKAGLSNWIEGFTRTAAQINNSANGTLVNWNIDGLADGEYNLRMKLNCPSGVVYSARATGTIDRKGPQLLGKPQPTDDNYVTGDLISATFNENLDCNSITNFNAELKDLSNGQLIDARLGCYQNNIVIVPLTSLSSFTGDSIKVTLRSITDQYGNIKATDDYWKFIVGSFVPDVSSRALKLVNSNASIVENSGDSITYTFKLPVNAPNDVRVNFSISGNSTWNTDYTISYGQPNTQSTSFNGSQGTVIIKQGTKSSAIKVKPIANTQYAPNKTITFTLTEGGDYLPGDTTSATGTIVNDDLPSTYTFTGNGDFTDAANWLNGMVPPYNTLISDEIIINPAANGECILNVPLRMRSGGKFIVIAGKKLRINGNVRVVNF